MLRPLFIEAFTRSLYVRISSRVATTSFLKIALEIDCESAFVTTLFHCFSQEEVFLMLARFNL